MRDGRKKEKRLRGFTLIEMMVSVGVFALMTVFLSVAFSSGFASFGKLRELQRNIESAQYSMNTLAKLLRTSTVVSGATSNAQSIRFYDYSSGRCFEYRISGSVLQARMKSIASAANCDTSSMSGWFDVTSSTASLSWRFDVTPSDNGTKKMGKVTIFLSIQKGASAAMRSDLQTSVSLRDYQYVGK